MKKLTLLFAAIGLALAAQGVPGTIAKTDFSGRWRMIKEKSDFAGFTTPDIVTRAIDQHDPVLNIHTVQTSAGKTSISDLVYSTDGAPTENVISGRSAQCKTYWDGPVLVVRTSMKTAKGDSEIIEDRWTLSNDRKTLTTTSHIETDKGQVDMTLVCDRQSAK